MKYHHLKMSLQTSKLYSVLKEHSNEVGLPILDNPTFESLTNEYGKEHFREVLSEYIATERPPFPFKKISHEKMRKTFLKLRDSDPFKTMTAKKDCKKKC